MTEEAAESQVVTKKIKKLKRKNQTNIKNENSEEKPESTAEIEFGAEPTTVDNCK